MSWRVESRAFTIRLCDTTDLFWAAWTALILCLVSKNNNPILYKSTSDSYPKRKIKNAPSRAPTPGMRPYRKPYADENIGAFCPFRVSYPERKVKWQKRK